MKVRGGIAGYFRHVGNILALSRMVKSQDVHTEKRTPTEGFLRGDVMFKDGSRLHFTERRFFVTMTPTIFSTCRPRRITSTLGKTMSSRQMRLIYSPF